MLRFQESKINQEVTKVKWVDTLPIGSISQGSPIDFFISGSGDDYLDLHRTRLYIKMQVVQQNGNLVRAEDKVSTANLMLHSLFSQVDINLQNIQINNGVGNHYPYKSYLDVVLNHGRGAKTTQLQAQGFYKDEGNFDDVDGLTGTNDGCLMRFSRIWTDGARAQLCDLEGPLLLDLCQQDIPLPNGVDVRLRLWPSKSPFFLTTPGDKEHRVIIHQAVLKVCKITPSPQLVLRNEQHLAKTTAKYPYMRSEISTHSLSAGSTQITLDDVFRGRVPSQLVVGLVDADAYEGSYQKNPFNFKHYKAETLGVYINGEALPTEPLNLSFDLFGGTYASAYRALFHCEQEDNFIDFEDFRSGYTLYSFNLDATDPSVEEVAKKKDGNLRVNIKFEEGLPEKVVVLLYAGFPDYLQLDKARNIIQG